MKLKDNTNFWETYVASIIPEITSGKKWYNFSMASLRTFKELNLAVEDSGRYLLTDGHTHFVLDSSGNCKKVIHDCVAYYKSPSAEQKTFCVSLAKKSFHD